MKIAITGASGFVGSHLAESMINSGHQVSCLVRKTSQLRWIEHLDFNKVLGDLTDAESLSKFVQGQDILIHSAALTKARTEADYLRTNTESTELLLESIRKFNPGLKQFMLISSQAAAGPSQDGMAMKESDPPQPITAYGRSKLKAEEITKKYDHEIPFTIIRPPAVFGPREQDILTYFKLINMGVQPVIGYENCISIVYIKNLVHGITLALRNEKAFNQTYYITDGGNYTWTELARLMAKALDKKTIRLRIPGWIIWFVAVFNTIYSAVFKKATLLNKEKILEMKQPYWLVSNEKAKLELGYRPLLSTEQGIRETAAWYKQTGWI